jgi:hypothetical protein
MGFLKIIFVGATIAATITSMSEFGPGIWSEAFHVVAVVVLISVFFKILDPVAIILGRVSEILAGLMLGLLLTAATIGGSFNMSDNNVVLAMLLTFMIISGLSAFFWDNRQNIDTLRTIDNNQ